MEEIARESSLWSEANWRNGFQFFISNLLSCWRREGERAGPLWRNSHLLSGDLETGDEMLCSSVPPLTITAPYCSSLESLQKPFFTQPACHWIIEMFLTRI